MQVRQRAFSVNIEVWARYPGTANDRRVSGQEGSLPWHRGQQNVAGALQPQQGCHRAADAAAVVGRLQADGSRCLPRGAQWGAEDCTLRVRGYLVQVRDRPLYSMLYR